MQKKKDEPVIVSSPVKVTVCKEAANSYTKEEVTMGDRSPKSVQKQASQKKNKSDSADQKKKQDVTAKQKQVVAKMK